MFSGLWGKVVAGGVAVLGIFAILARAFGAGKSAGQDEVIAETERAASEYEGRADEARRAGEIKEREVKHEEKPADFDRYR